MTTKQLKAQKKLKTVNERLVSKLDKMATIRDNQAKKEEQIEALVRNLLEEHGLVGSFNILKSELEEIQEEAMDLEAEIKELGLQAGETISGDRYQAVFNKGRVGWDNATLLAWAELMPSIMNAKKQGKPYISLKEVKSA